MTDTLACLSVPLFDVVVKGTANEFRTNIIEANVTDWLVVSQESSQALFTSINTPKLRKKLSRNEATTAKSYLNTTILTCRQKHMTRSREKSDGIYAL